MKKIRYTLILFLTLFIQINLSSQCIEDGNYWNDSWVSCQKKNNPNLARGLSHWIMYEFHENQNLMDSHFWNSNKVSSLDQGVRDIIIDYTSNGSTWIELGRYTIPQGTGSSNYTGSAGPSFNGLSVKSVLITIVNNYGAACNSLAEVRFSLDESNCNGLVDECGICNGPGPQIWYEDADNDGLGNHINGMLSCNQPSGFVSNDLDKCDDGSLGWEDVAPLFSNNGCLSCHGSAEVGGLDLRSYSGLLNGGNKCGPEILFGNRLVQIITLDGYAGCGDPIETPSMNDRASGAFDASELAILQRWIDGNAPLLCQDFDKCLDNGGSITGEESNCGRYDPALILNVSHASGGVGGSPSYIWEKKVENGDWIRIEEASLSSYDPGLITASTYFRRGATRDGCSRYTYSEIVVKTVEKDTDGDGICDSEDPTFGYCILGESCEDNDPCTSSGVYDENCDCITTYQDDDQDGICNYFDYTDGFCALGVPCSDNDPCTVNDRYDENCNCVGVLADHDNDGICDFNDDDMFLSCVFTEETSPGIYVGDDSCNHCISVLEAGCGSEVLLSVENRVSEGDKVVWSNGSEDIAIEVEVSSTVSVYKVQVYSKDGSCMEEYVFLVKSILSDSDGDGICDEDECTTLSPTIFLDNTLIAGGSQQIQVTVEVVELQGIPTTTPVRLYITQDPRYPFTFDTTMSSIAGRAVENDDWTYTGSNGIEHEFVCNTPILAYGKSSFGLRATYDPQSTSGETTFSVRLDFGTGGDCTHNDNFDDESVIYFGN